MVDAEDRSRRPATIYDVAQAAGVSHQTVSRFLKGYQGIRPETRARVVEALDRLGYRPNLSARSLRYGRSHRIAALTHDLSEVGPARVATGASVAAREAGYVLDLVSLDVRDPQAIERSLAELHENSLAGILALASTDEMVRAFETASVHVPFHLHTEPDDSGTRLSALAGHGIPALVQHMASLGHRAFVHLSGPLHWSVSRNRARAFESAIAACGGRLVETLTGDWSPRSGFEAISRLRALPPASAILAANDQMALGAMLALKQRGIRVPEDMSVTGIDDIPEAAYVDPPLTTLRQDFAETGRNSVLALLAKIEDEPLREVAWPHPQLVVRASSAAPGVRTG